MIQLDSIYLQTVLRQIADKRARVITEGISEEKSDTTFNVSDEEKSQMRRM